MPFIIKSSTNANLYVIISFIKSLLVISVIMQITEHSDEDCEPGSIINYLLSQFRWLDFVSDCNALVMGLLDLLSVDI